MDALYLIQQEQEHARVLGYSPERDALAEEPGAVATAARGYLDEALSRLRGYSVDSPPRDWPWDPEHYKPRDSDLENLVLAASLIVSEINRTLFEMGVLQP